MNQRYAVMGFVIGAFKFAGLALLFAYAADTLFDWYNINAHMTFSSSALILYCVWVIKNV